MHSRCLRAWLRPVGNMKDIFHEIIIIHTTHGPKRTKKNIGKISHFSMVRLSLLVRIRISGSGEMEANFLIILLRVVEKLLQVGIRGPPVRVVNDKGIYRVIRDFFLSQVWDSLRSSK